MDDLTPDDYRLLHELRFQIGRFLRFSERAAREEGLEPRQHQLMLAVRANAEGHPTVGELAGRLLIRHHSAVELTDRLIDNGLAERLRGEADRRKVRIRLTPKGEEKLQRLTDEHRDELIHTGPLLANALYEALKRFSQNHPNDSQTSDLI